MKSSCVVKGHVTRTGKVVVDGTVRLPAGDVELTVEPTQKLNTKPYSKKQKAKLKAYVRQIRAIKNPPPPKDVRTDDEIVYGYTRKREKRGG